MTGRVSFFLLVLGTVTSPHLARAGESLTHHGNFRAWQVFKLERNDLTACYAATQAIQFFPRGATRSQPILYVVRYPKTSTANTLEIRFGQTITSYQSVTAKVVARRKPPRDSFSITTKANTGFIADSADQQAFIKAMRKGRQIVVVSQPGVVDILEDRYSMFGVTKALTKLEALCPGPKPPEPKPVELQTPSPLGLKGTTAFDTPAPLRRPELPTKGGPK